MMVRREKSQLFYRSCQTNNMERIDQAQKKQDMLEVLESFGRVAGLSIKGANLNDEDSLFMGEIGFNLYSGLRKIL